MALNKLQGLICHKNQPTIKQMDFYIKYKGNVSIIYTVDHYLLLPDSKLRLLQV